MRLASGSLLGLIVIAALLAIVWTPHPVDGFDMANRFAGSTAAHPLGTDQYGRDILSMLMAGARTSLGVAAGAVAIGVGFGVPLGLAAVSLGRRGETVVMLAGDIVFAFPALIVAAMLTTFHGPGAGKALVAIGIFYIPVFMRLTAAAARRVLSLEFVDAARLAGKGRTRIAVEHVAPLVLPIILTQAATQFAVAILIEAGLSYVGLGAQAPAVSWGRMLAEAQTLMVLAPQLAVWPGVAIMLTVLAATTFGEALNRHLDPRFTGRA